MACPERRNRRILDYLNDGEELGIEEPVVTPRSPAAVEAAMSLLPRFRWAWRARLGRKGGGGKGKEEIAVEKCVHPSVSTSACETDGDTRPSDLGVGLSLVFLLAKTSDEFNKMVKVRAEMETLLKEIKDQVRKNNDGHDGHDVLKAHNSETDRNENERANVHLEDQVTSSSMEAVSYEKSSEDGCCCMRMDVLEEEFHAELERLQVNYCSHIPSFLPEEEHDAEPLDEITDYRQELNDDMGEAVEDEDNDDAEYNGVSPVELERRLHDLLHQRNQERIQKLELALQCAEKKLVEKEMEVCLWKDTAKLALRQDNDEIADMAYFL